jgi:flavin reductase (DIM6/NTAB) family NADH-FMN oxidoreductase RutF
MSVGGDQQQYRSVIGHLPTGVAVVTAATEQGPVGMTANAVCSLSLEPLLLLVCFENSSRTLPLIRQAGRYAVNVLSVGQDPLSTRFASQDVAELKKFDGVAHSVREGLPVIDGVVAWLACELRSMHPGGDHTIGIGEVTAMGLGTSRDPLLFYQGRYASLLRAPLTPPDGPGGAS